MGSLGNGAELAVLGQFREGREICHSPLFLQGNECHDGRENNTEGNSTVGESGLH